VNEQAVYQLADESLWKWGYHLDTRRAKSSVHVGISWYHWPWNSPQAYVLCSGVIETGETGGYPYRSTNPGIVFRPLQSHTTLKETEISHKGIYFNKNSYEKDT